MHRTRNHSLELGRGNLVRCLRCLLPSMPILPLKGKGRHKASTRAHGKEARDYRGQEDGQAKSEGRTRPLGARAKGRGGEKEDLELLVSEESQVLVV